MTEWIIISFEIANVINVVFAYDCVEVISHLNFF
jgi:hypothetical protein